MKAAVYAVIKRVVEAAVLAAINAAVSAMMKTAVRQKHVKSVQHVKDHMMSRDLHLACQR